ncbi:WecB/TagA/CpsF family glycosyltransferase [Desulforudis sp. 1088]|uniref:WecB/TagA/CpsF family glycosyltransferase n=2 Tax=Candidatus Desulforudis TaxID=471826 RepID=UPI003CE55780
MPTTSLLGARIDALSMREALEVVTALVTKGHPSQVITMNPEYLYRAQREPLLLDIANGAALVTADGVGIVWAARLAGRPVPERVTGIDLMLALLERASAKGWRVFLLGAAPGVAEEAAEKARERWPSLVICGTHHGYFETGEDDRIIGKVRAAAPDLLFLGLGAPKQELWGARYLQDLGVPVVMGVGGSFDVLAGKVKRAPAWLRKLHLEWLGRLLREPRRWRRQMVLPKFILMVLWRYRTPGRRNRSKA